MIAPLRVSYQHQNVNVRLQAQEATPRITIRHVAYRKMKKKKAHRAPYASARDNGRARSNQGNSMVVFKLPIIEMRAPAFVTAVRLREATHSRSKLRYDRVVAIK